MYQGSRSDKVRVILGVRQITYPLPVWWGRLTHRSVVVFKDGCTEEERNIATNLISGGVSVCLSVGHRMWKCDMGVTVRPPQGTLFVRF